MLVYTFDNTLDGLLTAVFDSFFLKQSDVTLLAEGEQMRAHEFHYWDAEYCGDAVRAEKASGKGAWDCVAGSRTLFAGYPHIYLAGCPKAAERLAEACRAWQRAHRTERP